MVSHAPVFDPAENPLQGGGPEAWDQLIEAVGPASILVLIRVWMRPALLRHATPEDVWQETLLHAWRDRASVQWQGVRAFRLFLLEVARNRLRDLADREFAQKRGDGHAAIPFSEVRAAGSSEGSIYAGPSASTTPSRVASDRERADMMAAALQAVPHELRDVVRMRLFEDTPLAEIAAALGLGVEGVRHRFRRGAELYRAELRRRLGPADGVPPG